MLTFAANGRSEMKMKLPVRLNLTRYLTSFFFIGVTVLLIAACSPATTPSTPDLLQTGQPVTPTDVWQSLLQKSAYPYHRPLPLDEPTAIDGIYVKFEPKEATPIPCRRCPDYMAEGGIWKISFQSGTFHILHVPTGWQGLGSYSVTGDQLTLFNDPKCPSIVGRYHWESTGDTLLLETIEDSCAADLRGHNLEKLPWSACDIAAGGKSSPEGC